MSPRVLIAEPDDELRATYQRYLTRRGCTVGLASTLAELREKAMSFLPDAIVTELDFPDGRFDDDGLLLGGEMGTVVVLASRRSQDGVGDAIRARVRAGFVKPFKMVRLFAALTNSG